MMNSLEIDGGWWRGKLHGRRTEVQNGSVGNARNIRLEIVQ